MLEVSAPCPTCKHPAVWVYNAPGSLNEIDCKRCEFDNDGGWE